MSISAHAINIPLVPCKCLLQKVWVLADLVHKSVKVSLQRQCLEEGVFGHRRREEREWEVGHDLEI